MPLNFPENPTLNQYYVYNGIRWRWNGYGWTSAGISGGNTVIGGICGEYVAALTGGVGITLTAPAGIVEISLRLDEPNIGPINTPVSHTAPSSFSADTGIARKVAFLEADGSISFDFIKNYDVFRNAEFNFDIVSFDIPGLSPQLPGIVGTRFSLDPYQANISYIQTPIQGVMFIPNATATTQSGFPSSAFSMNLSNFIFTSEEVAYNLLTAGNDFSLNNDKYIFRIGITGENNDNTQVYKTKDYVLYFYNHIIYGTSQVSNPSSLNNFATNGTSVFNKVLNPTRNYTVNINIPQDDSNPYYFYYAHPSRLGQARFRDNSTGLEGGFTQPIQVNYENPNGYNEAYNVYRSENANLGQISITVL